MADDVRNASGARVAGLVSGELLGSDSGGVHPVESDYGGNGDGFGAARSGTFVRFKNIFDGVVDGPLCSVVHYISPLSKRYKLTER